MSSQGSRAMVIGLTIVFSAVGAGISFGGCGLLISLPCVLAGVALIAVGVRMIDHQTTGSPLLPPQICEHLAVVGLIFASSAVTVVTGEASPAVCFSFFVTFLAGISLVTVGVLGA